MQRDVDFPEDTLEQVQQKIVTLRSRYNAESAPLLFDRFNANLAAKISDDPTFTYSGSPEDRTDVYSIVVVPGRGTYRTVLPPDQYPALYDLKAIIVKLEDKRRDLTFAAARQSR